jgi:hypothetical protein
MTDTVTDDKYYDDHAALLGHVALAWNDCHFMVLVIFHTLSGVSWEKACAIFLALKSDHDRREITLALMKEVLNTNNDQPIKDCGSRLLGQLGALAGERNLATHTMWGTVMPDRQFFPHQFFPQAKPEVRPHPSLPRAKNLKKEFRSQFSKLTTNLRELFRDLMDYEAALHEHLERRRNAHSEVGDEER